MIPFPAVDPIPLPAPVWLFKVLHILTLALHFVSVEMLLGGLAAALALNWAGRGTCSESGVRRNASAAMASRLPVLMTYVINLGVPPLLFAQVLYGRALYTSSVLIGIWWIGVIFLLIGCYWHIYRFTGKIEEKRRAWPMALIALALALLISRIYSTNMTLMLHPEAWQKLYAESPIGAHLPAIDPALTPRWLFMVIGGLAGCGLWMIWLAGCKSVDQGARSLLAGLGGRIAMIAIPVQIFLAYQVMKMQPETIRGSLSSNAWFNCSALVWLGGATFLTLLAAWSGFTKPLSRWPGWVILAVGIVTMLGMTTCRDFLRDVTLLSHGFDVQARVQTANWQVISVFLVTFVAGLGCVAWLISVVLRAKPSVEKTV